jgi:hypothetical protein
MRPSELFAQVSGVPLPVAAGRFAEVGVPVFPCVPDGKRPLIERGFYAATTDAGQVASWWRWWPAANIGVPTGAPSGLVVVDVDVHGPADGPASFDRATRAGLVGGWEVLVRTPTGGMHAYYPATSGVEQRSWQAGRAGVDFRGDGGYIIVPPSARTIDGTTAGYRVVEVGTGAVRTVDGKALRDFLDPRPEPRARPASGDPVGLEDAERLARWLGRQDTDRNLKLFWASCRLAEAGVPMADALDAVLSAAKSDFGPREITATVRSAYRSVHPAHARREASRERPADGWFSRSVPACAAPSGRGL